MTVRYSTQSLVKWPSSLTLSLTAPFVAPYKIFKTENNTVKCTKIIKTTQTSQIIVCIIIYIPTTVSFLINSLHYSMHPYKLFIFGALEMTELASKVRRTCQQFVQNNFVMKSCSVQKNASKYL